MIVSKGSRYRILNNELCRSIHSLKEGDSGVDTYDLRQLSDITTIEPIEIDAERQSKLRSSTTWRPPSFAGEARKV